VSYSPGLEQEGGNTILGASGAHSGPPTRVYVLRAGFPAIAFPQKLKLCPVHTPELTSRGDRLLCSVLMLGPTLGFWWVALPLYVRSGDTQEG